MAPNFKSQLEAARSIANPHVAIAEFTDNSMDAGATKIKVTSSASESNRFNLYVSDNGHGMTYEDLHRSLKLGSSQKEEKSDKNFGCKGVGMNLAATYLADGEMNIYSKTVNCSKINIGSFNIGHMLKNPNKNNWNILYNFKQMNLNEIEDSIVSNFLESVESGTVVVLKKMSRKTCDTKKNFDKLITTSNRGLSRIYRHIFQERDLQLFYNSSIIQSTGPGFDLKENFQDKIFFDDRYKDGWIKGTVSPFGTTTFSFRYRFVRIAGKSNKGTSSQSGGLSIMRNGREVTSQLLSGIRPRDFMLGNLVIEFDGPAEFLDNVLTFNGDKQVRTLEDLSPNFHVAGFLKKEFSKHWEFIKEINLDDSLKGASGEEQNKAWKYSEEQLRERFYESQRESLSITNSDEEIDKILIKEYVVPGSGFRLDLVLNGLPFEFKLTGDDPSRVVGQILSYIPYLIEDKKFNFVKDNVITFKLALGKSPTASLQRHIERINSSYKVGDVSLNIEIFDMTKKCPKLLEYGLTRAEKNKAKRAEKMRAKKVA